MSKIIKQSFLGFCIGVTVGMFFSLFFSKLYRISYVPSTSAFVSRLGGLTNAVLVSVILWGVIGIFWTLGAYIFKINLWSELKRTIVHFVISYIGFTVLALLCGWFSLSWLPYYTIIFIMAYVVMWTISYNINKKNVNEINQALKKRRE